MNAQRVAVAALIAVALVSCSNDTTPTDTLEPSPSSVPSSSAPPSPADPASSPSVEPPTVVAPEDKRLCAVAQDIADLDKDAQDTITRLLTAVNTAMSDEDADDAFEEGLGLIRREMKRLAPLATDTYDRLEKVVPRPLKQDVVLVKTVSLKLFDILSNLKKLEDFNDIQTKLERAGAAKAAKATLRIDAVTRKRCGISISG